MKKHLRREIDLLMICAAAKKKLKGKIDRDVGIMTRIRAVIFMLLLGSAASAQVQYQFNDTPRPEADVMVARYVLQIRGSEMWLVGRVFNRGLKPARNVRINPNLSGKHGTRPPGMTIYLNPSDVPPTSFQDFEGRVALFVDPDISARPTAEWNQ